MATTFHVLAVQNRTGTITSPTVTWPQNVKTAFFQVISTQFTDPTETIELHLDESRDNGNTWLFLAGVGPVAGGQTDKNGNPLLPALLVSLGDQELADSRLVRGSMTIVGTVRCGLDITING
jgi:hypothetical protein